jgi:hypothetical protein
VNLLEVAPKPTKAVDKVSLYDMCCSGWPPSINAWCGRAACLLLMVCLLNKQQRDAEPDKTPYGLVFAHNLCTAGDV